MSKEPAGEKANRGTSGRRRARSKATADPEMQAGATIDPVELNRFLALKSPDPHHILGAHHSSRGLIIRAFRPGAEKVELVIGKQRPQPMAQAHPSGLFEILIPDLTIYPHTLSKFITRMTAFLRCVILIPSCRQLANLISICLLKDGMKQSMKSWARMFGRLTG